MRRMPIIVFLYVLLFIAAPLHAQNYRPQNERITDFHSDIVVHPDSSLTVQETISVISTGQQIRHGIYRDFPTEYRASAGYDISAGFHVSSVTRDGIEIPYHVEAIPNGQRIYMGDDKMPIPPGEHSFVLIYEADRELGFFDKYDELYWNVTGNGCAFPIDKAEAAISLPPGASPLQSAGYTGLQGAHGKYFTEQTTPDGRVLFQTTRVLNPGEGFTVAVGWPKGFVHQPTAFEKFKFFIRDNKPVLFAVGALFLLFGSYVHGWWNYGRSPRQGTVIPLFAPPDNISPADMNYCLRNGFNDGGKAAFGAALVNAAVKGCVKIVSEGHGYLPVIFGIRWTQTR